MKRKNWLTLMVAAALLALPIGCSEDNSDDSSSSTQSYAGPGSEWTMTRTGDSYTFNMTDGSDSLTVNATGSALTTGHTKLTVTSATATGSATAPTAGFVAHAVEVSGTAFLLKPVDANSETIAMLSSGSCPSADFTANWVIGHRPAGGNKITNTTADWYGSIVWDTAGGQASFPVQRSVESGGAAGGEGSTQTIGVCSSGTVSTAQTCNDGATTMKVYFTSSGLAIVATCIDDSVDESHIIGIPQPSAAISATTNLHGNYAGFIFDGHNNDSFAITGTGSAGSGTTDFAIQVVSGNDLDTTGSSYTMSFDDSTGVDSPANGFLSGAFSSCTGGSDTGFDNTCEVVCSYAENVNSSGKNMIYCVGQHPDDEDDRVTVLLVEN